MIPINLCVISGQPLIALNMSLPTYLSMLTKSVPVILKSTKLSYVAPPKQLPCQKKSNSTRLSEASPKRVRDRHNRLSGTWI